MKRILVATFFGLLAGAICAAAAFRFNILSFSAVTLVWILLNRAVMGFTIGISGLKLHWALNGILVGLATGAIFSYFLFMNTRIVPLAIGNFLVNGVFGLLIELFTTVVCRQRALPAVRSNAATV